MEAPSPHGLVAPSRSSRAGRFTLSKSARKEVRRAVALGKELDLHSVTVRGVVWTLNHTKQSRKSSSGQRARAVKDAADAEAQTREGDTDVPERESRPPNRRKRRSRKRLGLFQAHEVRSRAQREDALPLADPSTVASLVDDAAASHTPADEAITLRELADGMDDESSLERSPTRSARSSAVDESSAVWASGPTASTADPGALARCLAPASPSRGRPSTDSSEPPTPLPDELAARQAARRLSEACASSAADASTPHHKRRRRNRRGRRGQT